MNELAIKKGDLAPGDDETYLIWLNEIEEMLASGNEPADEVLISILRSRGGYPHAGWNSTKVSWENQAVTRGRYNFLVDMKKLKVALEQRLNRAYSEYEKVTGNKLKSKDIKKSEEKAKLAVEEYRELSNALLYMCPKIRREEIPTTRNVNRTTWNIKEIKEKIAELEPDLEDLLQSYERISGRPRESIVEYDNNAVKDPLSGSPIKKKIYSYDRTEGVIRFLKMQRMQELVVDGLPRHVATIMAENEISDADGIAMLRELRNGDVTRKPANYDTIVKVEEMAFSGKINLEEALLLVENSSHKVLISEIYEEKIKMDFAKKLLTELNFSSHPQATARVVKGGDLNRVAMLFGIVPTSTTEPEESEPEDLEEVENKSSSVPTRRRTRFSD